MSDTDLEALTRARGNLRLDPLPHPSEQQTALTAEPDVVGHGCRSARPGPGAPALPCCGTGAAAGPLPERPGRSRRPRFRCRTPGFRLPPHARRSGSARARLPPTPGATKFTLAPSGPGRWIEAKCPPAPRQIHAFEVIHPDHEVRHADRPEGQPTLVGRGREPVQADGELDIGQPDLGLIAGAVAPSRTTPASVRRQRSPGWASSR